jgi:hypothetical protein
LHLPVAALAESPLTLPPPLVEEFELGELQTRPAANRSLRFLDEDEAETASEAARRQRRREKLERLIEEDEMKFSHSIQFNAVPDWSSHYIAYSNLKKL